MMNQQVWKKTSKSLIPPNHRYVKCKCVFKIEHNGVDHTR